MWWSLLLFLFATEGYLFGGQTTKQITDFSAFIAVYRISMLLRVCMCWNDKVFKGHHGHHTLWPITPLPPQTHTRTNILSFTSMHAYIYSKHIMPKVFNTSFQIQTRTTEWKRGGESERKGSALSHALLLSSPHHSLFLFNYPVFSSSLLACIGVCVCARVCLCV